jgi:hypothetical protein
MVGMSGIGHNRGPSMEGGTAWRAHCWKKARADLLPTLPLEVVRLRVKRAAEIGLDYRTYASFRAASGHDIVALLFSTNALRLLAPAPRLPDARAERLAAIKATARAALARAPLSPEAVLALAPGLLDQAFPAPRAFAEWGEARRMMLAALAPQRWPTDRVLMVGDTSEEQVWAEAARLGGYLSAARYFSEDSPRP